MRKQTTERASPVIDMKNVHNTRCGRKKRMEAKGAVCIGSTAPRISVNK